MPKILHYDFFFTGVPSWSTAIRQDSQAVLAAYLGDLAHKRDLAIHFGAVTEEVTWRVSNAAQAAYLRQFCPELVPEPAQPGQPPSQHTLGTVFELHYFHCPSFVRNYLQRADQLVRPVSP